MIPDEPEYMDDRQMCIELATSINSLEARIDELRIIMNTGSYALKDTRRQSMLERVVKLNDTKHRLMYTIMDIAGAQALEEQSSNPFVQIDTSYKRMHTDRRRTLPTIRSVTKKKTRLKQIWQKIRRM